tara:strand:- start:1733 stop:2158 length:426 start_codon:yes stop_codon:yes gene_type:complete
MDNIKSIKDYNFFVKNIKEFNLLFDFYVDLEIIKRQIEIKYGKCNVRRLPQSLLNKHHNNWIGIYLYTPITYDEMTNINFEGYVIYNRTIILYEDIELKQKKQELLNVIYEKNVLYLQETKLKRKNLKNEIEDLELVLCKL